MRLNAKTPHSGQMVLPLSLDPTPRIANLAPPELAAPCLGHLPGGALSLTYPLVDATIFCTLDSPPYASFARSTTMGGVGNFLFYLFKKNLETLKPSFISYDVLFQ